MRRDASDKEVRAAYHRLVQLHHPDHNSGSAESARRFEEVQDAYAEIRRIRASGGQAGPSSGQRARASSGGQARPSAAPPPRPSSDPGVEARLADIEREVREAQAARERARRAAAEAAARAAAEAAREAGQETGERRPSDEELGYVHTDDTFLKILADARSELAARLDKGLDEAQSRPVAKRVSDLIDEVTDRLKGEGRDKR